jgi:hypothetical protein
MRLAGCKQSTSVYKLQGETNISSVLSALGSSQDDMPQITVEQSVVGVPRVLDVSCRGS